MKQRSCAQPAACRLGTGPMDIGNHIEREIQMAAPETVYCDEETCKFNDSGECCCEELRISDMKECDSYEGKGK